MGEVPCGHCSACCKLNTPLHPELGDDVESYDYAIWRNAPGGPRLILNRKRNGECVYLDEHGKCSIYARRPYQCRQFDCRVLFASYDRTARRLAIRNGKMTKEIFDRGRELLG